MNDTSAVARGVVALAIEPTHGTVIAATDFELHCPGGFSLREAQTMRAKARLAREVVHTYCGEIVAAVIDGYDSEKILRSLQTRAGVRVSIIPINWDEAAEKEDDDGPA